MSGKLNYEKGKPLAYIKKGNTYKIIYLNENADKEKKKKEEEQKKQDNGPCESCLQGGCMNCSGDCQDGDMKCCELCE